GRDAARGLVPVRFERGTQQPLHVGPAHYLAFVELVEHGPARLIRTERVHGVGCTHLAATHVLRHEQRTADLGILDLDRREREHLGVITRPARRHHPLAFQAIGQVGILITSEKGVDFVFGYGLRRIEQLLAQCPVAHIRAQNGIAIGLGNERPNAVPLLGAKQWDRVRALIPQADRDPVLGSYVRYWALRQQLLDPAQPIPEDEIHAFFARNQDAYLADRLKGEWMVAAGRAGDYAQVLALAPVEVENAEIRCTLLMAQHMSGRKVRASDAMDAFSSNQACWAMLDQFYERRVVGWSDVQRLLRASLETNRHQTSRRIAAVIFNGAQMRDYSAIMNNPRKWLEGRAVPRSPAELELVAIALSRLAYGEKRLENAAWVEKNWEGRLPRPYMEWVWSQFGLVAALNVELDAARWYRKSGNFRMTDYNHAWQVRSELRQPVIDWDQVAKAIRRMSAAQAAEPVWVYWYARALHALGNEKAAVEHYRSIAHDLSFYGLLASEELGHPQPLPPAPAQLQPEELDAARNHPGLQRAVALFELGWRPEAVPEWNFNLRGMNDRELLAAAEFAREKHIYDRVVNTSLRTEKEIDLSQRFIAPFSGEVSKKAREIDLDPAWVYGVIRQESRFITDARSRVGA